MAFPLVPTAPVKTAPRLVRERDGAIVVERLEVADTFATRLRGLMGKKGLAPRSGLWIEPCNSIHMMFVGFPIDAIWVDGGGVVLKVSSAVRPWIGLAACSGARAVIELPAGAAAQAGVAIGDRLLRREPGAEARREPGEAKGASAP